MYIDTTDNYDEMYEMLEEFGDHEPLMGPSDIHVFVNENGDTYGLETADAELAQGRTSPVAEATDGMLFA